MFDVTSDIVLLAVTAWILVHIDGVWVMIDGNSIYIETIYIYIYMIFTP